MNEGNKKTNLIKDILKNDFDMIVSNKWINIYLHLYSKCTPLAKRKVVESLDLILDDPKLFVHFIYGVHAGSVNRKYKYGQK